MSTMVERVARAMCEAADDNWDWSVFYIVDANDTAETGRDVYRDMARAAIEAMIPFFKEIPSANFIRTTDTDPGRVWSIAAEVQLGAVIGHLRAALKEQA